MQPGEASMDLLKLQTNLTVLNQILMHLEFEENGITLPAFSKTNIEPHWLKLYKYTPQQLEYLIVHTMITRAGLPNDKDSVFEFLQEIENDPESYWNEIKDDNNLEKQEAEYLEHFNSMPEDERSKEIESQALIFHTAMALSFNYISIMISGFSIQELLFTKEKLGHQDIYNLVKADKCLIFHEKVHKEIAKQQFDGNTLFFDHLGRSLSHVKFKTDKKFPRVYFALSVLEKEGYIEEGRMVKGKYTAKELLNLLDDAGFYFPKKATANEDKFRQLVKKFHNDRKHRLNPYNQ